LPGTAGKQPTKAIGERVHELAKLVSTPMADRQGGSDPDQARLAAEQRAEDARAEARHLTTQVTDARLQAQTAKKASRGRFWPPNGSSYKRRRPS
jgi:hypothetical protein